MSSDQREERYVVDVEQAPEGLKPSKESLSALKGVVSKRFLSSMEKEAVNCPVFQRSVPFPQCMTCPNFVRRFRGKGYCRGVPIQRSDSDHKA